jgi:hypothetical protein
LSLNILRSTHAAEDQRASIIESKIVEIDCGSYELLFETGLEENDQMWCQFSFVASEEPNARILKADQQLRVPERLLLDAELAR